MRLHYSCLPVFLALIGLLAAPAARAVPTIVSTGESESATGVELTATVSTETRAYQVKKRTASVLAVFEQSAYVNLAFEYGTDETYGQTVAVYRTLDNVAYATLTDLSPDTVYHFRFTATTSLQTLFGPDATFRTTLYSDLVAPNDDVAFFSGLAPLVIPVLANDLVDPGESLRLVDFEDGVSGHTKLGPGPGDITFVPIRGRRQVEESFDYTVENPNGDRATGRVTIYPMAGHVDGSYAGPIDGGTFETRGMAQFRISATGGVTGQARLGAGTWPFMGRLLNKDFHATARAPHQEPLQIELHFDNDMLATGTVKFASGLSVAADFARPVRSRRVPMRYTIHLPPAPGTSAAGHGYAIMNVTAGGLTTLAGRFGNGQPLSMGGLTLDGSGAAPALLFYACLNARRHESLLGSIDFYSTGEFYSDSYFAWTTPEAAKLASGQQTVSFPALGVEHFSTIFGISPLDLYIDFPGQFTGTVIGETPFSYPFALSKRKVPMVGPGLSFTIRDATGLVFGTALDPNTHRRIPFGGVLSAEGERIYGMLLDHGAAIGPFEIDSSF